jgi:hypothetical protein
VAWRESGSWKENKGQLISTLFMHIPIRAIICVYSPSRARVDVLRREEGSAGMSLGMTRSEFSAKRMAGSAAAAVACLTGPGDVALVRGEGRGIYEERDVYGRVDGVDEVTWVATAPLTCCWERHAWGRTGGEFGGKGTVGL